MADRTRSETLRGNERVKVISSIMANLGTALLATAVGRWFLAAFDAYVLLWLIVALVLMWSAWYVMTMLEEEG